MRPRAGLQSQKLGAETTLSFLDLNFDPPILVGKLLFFEILFVIHHIIVSKLNKPKENLPHFNILE
jgi:hypothetical protein